MITPNQLNKIFKTAKDNNLDPLVYGKAVIEKYFQLLERRDRICFFVVGLLVLSLLLVGLWLKAPIR